jgi:outer membrane protein
MKEYRKHLLLFSLLLMGSQQSLALDFLQAYELAQQSDPDIQAARYEYESILDSRPQARAALLPNLTLDIFAQQVEQDSNRPTTTTTTTTTRDYDASGYRLSLVQSIYQHDLYLTLEQTDLSIASAAASYDAAKQALILRVAEAYYAVLAAGDNLAFARAEKNAIGEQLEQARRRFEVGLIAITDVKESQAQYDLSVAQEIRAENQLSTTMETLRTIIGQMPETVTPLAEDIPLLIPEPVDINQWVETAKQNNLALKSAQYTFDMAMKQVDIDRAGHYPSLNLTLSHDDVTTDIDSFPTIEEEDTSIILNLSVPIYSGGLTSARTRAAVSQKERARALKEKTIRDTVKLSRDSYLGVTTSIAQVEALKQALISTQTAYEATQAGFEVGTRTAVEVLSVLREQYRAERDYAQARYDYILNILRLKQAAGILGREDVVYINSLLTP